MSRTVRAAAMAAIFGLVIVAALGLLLGFEAGASVIAGVVAAVAFGGLILAAAARSGSLEDPPQPHVEGSLPPSVEGSLPPSVEGSLPPSRGRADA